MGILKEIIQEHKMEEKVCIRDEQRVEALLQTMIKEGSNKLQVITDFDFTLTRFHKDGEPCISCHGILDCSPLMPQEFKEKAQASVKKYYPIEIDHKMTPEEKIPLMIEWYDLGHSLLVEYKVSKSKIRMMVDQSRALLRDSARDVLSYLNEQKIPVLIFSGGVGDLLEEVLYRENSFFPNLKVISNYMVFDDKGECLGFKEPLVHMFNKNETALEHSSYFDELSHRNNALVLGDSLGDVNMDKGLQNPGAILKIGFLNDKIDERLDSFTENFDIVLLDDQTFDFVNLIVRKIAQT